MSMFLQRHHSASKCPGGLGISFVVGLAVLVRHLSVIGAQTIGSQPAQNYTTEPDPKAKVTSVPAAAFVPSVLSYDANLSSVSALSLTLGCQSQDGVHLMSLPLETAIKTALEPGEGILTTYVNCLVFSDSRQSQTSPLIREAVITINTGGSSVRESFQLALSCHGASAKRTYFSHPKAVQIHSACTGCNDAPQVCTGCQLKCPHGLLQSHECDACLEPPTIPSATLPAALTDLNISAMPTAMPDGYNVSSAAALVTPSAPLNTAAST
eukprot:scpid85554/ scgid32863/ 